MPFAGFSLAHGPYRERCPTAHLDVVGALGPGVINDTPDERITFHGHVGEHLAPLYDNSRVFIAPIRFSAGAPLEGLRKRCERTAGRCDRASTRHRFAWDRGVEIMCAPVSAADEFVGRCEELHKSAATWNAVRHAAQRRVALDCDVATFEATLLDAVISAPWRVGR